jgi:hypothetical protein
MKGYWSKRQACEHHLSVKETELLLSLLSRMISVTFLGIRIGPLSLVSKSSRYFGFSSPRHNIPVRKQVAYFMLVEVKEFLYTAKAQLY